MLIYFYILKLICINLIKVPLSSDQSFKKIRNRTKGTTVYRIQVHSESAAVVALRSAMVQEFSTDLNALKTVMEFFGGIFDMINEDIQNLGLQVRGDFSELLIDYMPWDKKSCQEGDPLRARTQVANSVFSRRKSDFGTKLVLLFCKEKMYSDPNSFIQENGCNSVTGIMFGELRALKDTVKDAVYKIISNGHGRPINNTNNFERGLSKKVTDCIGSRVNENGEFVKDLKAVRHLATERYILKEGESVREHDKMDNIYLLKAGKKRIVGYPTEDYSNDEELYTDKNEKE